MITILSFILVIGVVVFIHELGHFIAAKSVGVRVEKFYIGFNLFGLGLEKEYKDTKYGIGLFPLGGYVKLAGVIDESLDTISEGSPNEFKSKNTFQKIWIMSAGVIMNFILSIFIFSHLTFYNGITEPDNNAIIGEIVSEYPAEKLGLKQGDQILSINNIEIDSWKEMTTIIHSKPNEIIHLTWNHNNKLISGSVKTEIAKSHFPWEKDILKGVIGIKPKFTNRSVTIIEAFSNGISQTYTWLNITYKTLLSLLTGDVSMKEMAGPIMIGKIAGEAATTGGLYALLGLMAIISVNLGLVNILPIPGLDGGHIFIALIEGIIKREIPIKIKLGIQQIGMFIILILFFTIMFNDIQKLLQ